MVRVSVVHVAMTPSDAVQSVYGKFDVLHVAEAAEDLHDVLLRNVPGETADVDAQRSGSGLATLLARLGLPRCSVPGSAPVLLVLVHGRPSLVILFRTATAGFAVAGPRSASQIVALLVRRLFLVQALAARRHGLALCARPVAGARR